MIYLKAILLAVVEGLTEFLPVSSTGHLVLVDTFVRLSDDAAFNALFIVVIQLPAVLSVAWYFRRRLWPFGRPRDEARAVVLLWARVVAAFLPAAVIGKLFQGYIKAHLFNAVVVALALAGWGVVLVLLERRRRTPVVTDLGALGYGRAVGIGFLQCLAMIPGTSRSAATIIGAMSLGLSRAAAAEFSFFLAIPTMLGATVLDLSEGGLALTPMQWSVIALGSVVSFAVAYAVVAFLMNYIRRHDFKIFGYYRIVLGCIVLALWAAGIMRVSAP